MPAKSGVAEQIISLPKGGGALHGLGEKFQPDLFTGTGSFSVPVIVPPGRGGLQPQLALTYSSGGGNGPFGLGWSLNIPAISRKTSKGIPRYRDGDTYILSGSEELVLTGEETAAGVTRRSYRPRTEGIFARIVQFQGAGINHWEITAKNGIKGIYGQTEKHRVFDRDCPDHVYQWLLAKTEDTFGNCIVYRYKAEDGLGLDNKRFEENRRYNQVYLSGIDYIDYETDETPADRRYLFSVELDYGEYEDNETALFAYPVPVKPWGYRPDPFSCYSAGFEVRTVRRCRRILVKVREKDDPAAGRLIRSYRIRYLDELPAEEMQGRKLPPNGVSLPAEITVTGWEDDGETESMPPLSLQYTSFEPEKKKYEIFSARGDYLPERALNDPEYELVDLHGFGLPDIIHASANGFRCWRNLGNCRFDFPRLLKEMPAGLTLADPGVLFADMEGNGSADLLVTNDRLAGYFPTTFDGEWSPDSLCRYRQAPSIDLKDPRLKLVDMDGDGVIDALYTGDSYFLVFYNRGRAGWENRAQRIPRQRLDVFPDVSFSDPGQRVRLAAMSGSGLQDIVLLHDRRIDYWPNLGYGRWGKRITMRNAPALPPNYNPARLFLADIDGDGCADLLYIESGRVRCWINRCGNTWSEEHVIEGTPPVSDSDALRLADMKGTGTAGILWSYDHSAQNRTNYKYLDLTGGVKPYLLNRIENNIGAVTLISYAPSTKFALEDRENGSPWQTRLPFPVQVVERVEVRDHFPGGRLVTRYSYHHGCWDGAEREFRGFGMVEQYDTETFEECCASHPCENQPETRYFTPPTLTKTWFHLGPTGGSFDDWHETDYSGEYWAGDSPRLRQPREIDAYLESLPRRVRRDALRALRGSILRSETYALDGTERRQCPYAVTEYLYGLREEEPPAEGSADRQHLFFPFLLAQRFTHWERGDDPMTRYSFTEDYDAFGQPRLLTEIALPRRSVKREPPGSARVLNESRILATCTRTQHAVPDTGLYIRNRVAQVLVFGLTDPPGVVGRDPDDLLALLEDQYLAAEAVHRQFRDLASQWQPGKVLPDGLCLLSHIINHYDGSPAQSFTGRSVGEVGPYGVLTRSESLVFTGAAGLTTTAVYDYSRQQPREITDPNGNRTVYTYTPLGLLESVYVKGKNMEGDRQQPSRKMIYNYRAFLESGQPISVRTILGVHHDSDTDVPLPGREETIESIEYSDGFGRLLQTRTQGEDVRFGEGLFGDGDQGGDGLPATGRGDRACPAEVVTGRKNNDAARPNVVISGRKAYDNKGRVVESYEPYFSAGWEYEPPPDQPDGYKITFHYDPLGRVVRTVHTDGSEERVVYGIPPDLNNPDCYEPSPWETYTYDANDNAGRTETADPQADFYDHHWNTPVSSVRDALGRTITVIERNRLKPEDGQPLPVLPVQEHITSSSYDVLGNLLAVTDALGRIAFSYVYDLVRRPLRLDSIDAGRRITVWNALGSPVGKLDSKGAVQLRVYDLLNRPLQLWARNNRQDTITLREQIEYGDGSDPDQPTVERSAGRAKNRLGRVHKHYDEAGLLTFEEYDFKGNVLERSRRVLKDDLLLKACAVSASDRDKRACRINWDLPRGTSLTDYADLLLEPVAYRTSTAYDALERIKYIRLPRDVGDTGNGTAFSSPSLSSRKVLRPHYNRAGALKGVDLDGSVFVEHIAYNARGQRTLIVYGNGVMTRYAYHKMTFRLLFLRTEHFERANPGDLTYRPAGKPLQDYFFRYDLAGNILFVEDRTTGCGVGQTDTLERWFRYDALYRLVSASGREKDSAWPPGPWEERAHGNTGGTRIRAYRQIYSYDPVGNMLKLEHDAGTGNSFSRLFTLKSGSNRLDSLTTAGVSVLYTYDENGNMTGENSGRSFTWDHSDRMVFFCCESGEPNSSTLPTIYLYDGSGRRVKKLVRKQSGEYEVTVYIDEIFEHHRLVKGGKTWENNTLHIMDDTNRIAALRIGTTFPDEREPEMAVKYHLGDHLGSSRIVIGGKDHRGNSFISLEEYYPFGETSLRSGSFSSKRYRFTGKERDGESGLYYHGARYYAPWLAKWTSCDPAGLTGGINLYLYTDNNPLVFVDYNGAEKNATGARPSVFSRQYWLKVYDTYLWYTGKYLPEKQQAYDMEFSRRVEEEKKRLGSGIQFMMGLTDRTVEDRVRDMMGPRPSNVFVDLVVINGLYLLPSRAQKTPTLAHHGSKLYAAARRALATRADLGGTCVYREIEASGARIFRHTVTQQPDFISAANIEATGSIRISKGISAHYGEGIYVWEPGATGVGQRYIDIMVSSETVAEKIVTNYGKTFYRLVPPSGESVPVKVVGSNFTAEEIALGRSIIGSTGKAVPWPSNVTDARGVSIIGLATSGPDAGPDDPQ